MDRAYVSRAVCNSGPGAKKVPPRDKACARGREINSRDKGGAHFFTELNFRRSGRVKKKKLRNPCALNMEKLLSGSGKLREKSFQVKIAAAFETYRYYFQTSYLLHCYILQVMI